MKTSTIILAWLASLSLATGVLLADIPPPPNATQKEREAWERGRAENQILRNRQITPPAPARFKQASLVLYGAEEPRFRLILPATLVKQLQEALGQKTGALDSNRGRISLASLMTGLALSLGLVSAGICAAKSRRRWTCGVAACLAAMTMVIGVGCPGLQRNDSTQSDAAARDASMNKDGQVQGRVNVEVSNNTENVEIVMDKKVLSSFVTHNSLKTE